MPTKARTPSRHVSTEPDAAWMDQAFTAFADDILSSDQFEKRVAELVDQRLRTELDDLRDEVRAVEENLAGLASEWIAATPHTPYPAAAGQSHSPTPLLQRGRRVSPPLEGEERPPTSRRQLLRIGLPVAGLALVLVLLSPSRGAVGEMTPAVVAPVVTAPMPGTADAPIPLGDVAVQPPADARFSTTTTTR